MANAGIPVRKRVQEFELLFSLKQAFEQNFHFLFHQDSANAIVCTLTKGNLRIGGSSNIELVGMLKNLFIPVAGTNH